MLVKSAGVLDHDPSFYYRYDCLPRAGFYCLCSGRRWRWRGRCWISRKQRWSVHRASSTGAAASGAAATPNSNQTGQTGQGSTTPFNGGNNNSARITNPQTPTQSTVASEQNSAVTGMNTKATPTRGGAVSAPGVGVGHSANGLPIGSPGSGPGSPEQPIDSGSR